MQVQSTAPVVDLAAVNRLAAVLELARLLQLGQAGNVSAALESLIATAR